MELETVNGRIESTMLGYEDHGILTCSIVIVGGGWGQGFGGYAFDQYVGKREAGAGTRVGTSYGMEFIRRVLDVIGVERWESLTGKHVRIRRDNGRIYSIGHIIEDKWFTPDTDMEAFKQKES